MLKNQYQLFVKRMAYALLMEMKDSPLIHIEDWEDDARDIISELRAQSIKDKNLIVDLIESFYIKKEKHDNFTDFKKPSEKIANVYLEHEYI